MAKTTIAFPTLRAEMARQNLTISDLAECLGIARDTMSRKLSGKQFIRLDESVKLQEVYFKEIELGKLFTKDSQQRPA